MANKYTVMSEDSIRYVLGLIRDLASVSEAINNTNLADDKVFSNLYTKKLIDKCLEDANTEAQKLVGALTHLTCEETTVQPTLNNSTVNVIYLYSADGNAPYQQYLKISDTKLVDLGSTSISLSNYLTATEIARDYVTKLNFDALKTKVDGKVDKIDIVDNLTSTDTNKPLSANQGKVLKDEVDLKANDSEVLKKTDISTTIDSSSTDDTFPTSKAVETRVKNRLKYADTMFSTDALGISIEFNKEYTLEKSMNNYEIYDGYIHWKQTSMARRSWYDDDWDILTLTTNDDNDTMYRVCTLRLLIKHSDGKIIKFLTSNYINFNLTDGSFSIGNVTSGIYIFALR